METLKVKNAELVELEFELSEVIKGIKSFVPKFHINKFVKNFENDFKLLAEAKNEIVKKYGEEKDGQIVVKQFEDEEKKVITEAFKSFINDYQELLSQEVEVSYTPIKLEMFKELESEFNFPVLYKFITE